MPPAFASHCPITAPASLELRLHVVVGLKLFSEAQASISVPSTEKCSLDNSRFNRGCARTESRNLAATSPPSSRSRLFEKVE